jgi:hypothetical protein
MSSAYPVQHRNISHPPHRTPLEASKNLSAEYKRHKRNAQMLSPILMSATREIKPEETMFINSGMNTNFLI